MASISSEKNFENLKPVEVLIYILNFSFFTKHLNSISWSSPFNDLTLTSFRLILLVTSSHEYSIQYSCLTLTAYMYWGGLKTFETCEKYLQCQFYKVSEKNILFSNHTHQTSSFLYYDLNFSPPRTENAAAPSANNATCSSSNFLPPTAKWNPGLKNYSDPPLQEKPWVLRGWEQLQSFNPSQ